MHLGATDLPVAEARRVADGVSSDLLVGATCRTSDAARAAAADGADYAGFGPVFATTSKVGLPDPLGPGALAAAAGELPLVGIGGIDATNDPDPLTAAGELVAAVG